MKYLYLFNAFFVLCLLSITISCKEDPVLDSECNPTATLLVEYFTSDGDLIKVFDDGSIYIVENGVCEFAVEYFSPTFFEDTYIATDSGFVLQIDDTTFIKPYISFEENFEASESFLDYFINSADQINEKLFTSFTLQSPSAPTVNDYVQLRQCILDETCDFIDNRIDISQDPLDAGNQVIKFYAVPPSANMVTSKSSISSELLFFEKGDDFWFEAKFYLEKGIPSTLADFESSYFNEHPGPRIFLRGGQVTIENKFLDKKEYRQKQGQEISLPMKEWVTLKVHLLYDTSEGVIEVWQNGQLIIQEIGMNMPVENWIQNNLEVGISATQDESILYVDDIRFSDSDW